MATKFPGVWLTVTGLKYAIFEMQTPFATITTYMTAIVKNSVCFVFLIGDMSENKKTKQNLFKVALILNIYFFKLGVKKASEDYCSTLVAYQHLLMGHCILQEADIEHRTQALKREGFWSMKRLTRLTEPQRPKVHWEYLCEEMQWLSADFAQERRWKRGVARKVTQTYAQNIYITKVC